jgi:hypothetical protein
MNIHNVLKQIEANQKRVRMFVRTKKDGTSFLVPAYKRGNEEYAYKYGRKFMLYKQNFLREISNNSVMAITLVTPYGDSYDECQNSWKTIHKVLGAYIKSIKKLGVDKYIAVMEATSKGLCHVHLLVSWNRSMKVSVHDNKYYLLENEFSKSIRENWRKEWMKVSKINLKNNSIAVRISPDLSEAEKAFDYATKFLGHGSDITNALYRVRENKAIASDINKLFTNYWAFKLNIRLYRFSRNLGKRG